MKRLWADRQRQGGASIQVIWRWQLKHKVTKLFSEKYKDKLPIQQKSIKINYLFSEKNHQVCKGRTTSLSPQQERKMERKGESLVKFIVRNVIGRENLITCGWTNELAHALLTEYTHSVTKLYGWQTGLDSTTLHYLAIRRAMVSIHRLVHSKITLTYSLTWQTDHCTLRRMAFQVL